MKYQGIHETEASSFDKVLSRLEKITERVNENLGDVINSLPEERDNVEKRDDRTNYREKLEALSRKARMSPRNTSSATAPHSTKPVLKKRTPKVKGDDFEVELVLSMSTQLDTETSVMNSKSKKAANDIIWRAYATTKSFGAIIAGVIATQAVARRWLTVKWYREEMRGRVEGVSRIKAVWKGHCCRRQFAKAVKDVVMCQCLIRRHLATRQVGRVRHDIAVAKAVEKKRLEAEMATVISSNWRMFYEGKLYKQSIGDIIIVQSLIRRHAARNKAAIMRHERDTAAATILQAKYRSFHATKTYKSVMRKIIAIQCFVRQFIALRMLNKLKEERRILEDEMTTKIATTWRRHHYQCVYKRAVENVIICQSIVRRHAAIEELNLLKFQRDTAVATLIETEVRAYIARKHYKQMRSSIILLQSLVRQMIAYNELEELSYEKMMLEEYCATRIAAVWRSYYTRTGYIIVLKAARKHEQRCNAASAVQAQWRSYVARGSFIEMKTSTIKIQSVVRMLLATKGLVNKKIKISEAANFHTDDYFAYSIKRKAAAVKVQSVYRMHPVRKDYLVKKIESERHGASNKIQSAYRKRYSARMSRVTSDTNLASPRPIFDDGLTCYDVEVELGQHPAQHHVKDFFASAKQRQAASTAIQTAFRGHLARESAKKTAYQAKHAFELSKQRRVAADTIQNAYRKHLFRTTCHFRPVPSCDETCTDIVPYIAPTDGGFEIVAAGADFFALIMSMIAG